MNLLERAFGRHKTPQERLRQHQRALERTQRELQREQTKMEAQEKRLIGEIRKSASSGEMDMAKIKVKDLVRTRKQMNKFMQIKTQLQAISLRIQTVRTHEQMAQSMKSATRLLGKMNRSIHVPALMKIAHDFELENDIMDQREEMMDDAIDNIMEDSETENEEIMSQVLDEIGIDLRQNLNSVPPIVHTVGKSQKVAEIVNGLGDSYHDDFRERIEKLKR